MVRCAHFFLFSSTRFPPFLWKQPWKTIQTISSYVNIYVRYTYIVFCKETYNILLLTRWWLFKADACHHDSLYKCNPNREKNRLSTYVIFWLPVHFVCICDFDLSLMAWLGLVLIDGRTTSTTTATAITYHPDPTETYFHFFGLDTPAIIRIQENWDSRESRSHHYTLPS